MKRCSRSGALRAVTSVLFVLSLFVLQSCSTVKSPRALEAADDVTSLSVALYPWVPRLDQFKTVLMAAWRAEEPEVALRFVDDWDGYSQDPPPDLDVFVFDAIMFDHFHSRGFLEPIAEQELDDPQDFLSYALRGVRIDGQLWGIPQIGCGSILFYRQGDEQLAAATTLDQVVTALGQCTYSGETPPPGVGLMVDLSGGTTDACLYLDAVQDIYGLYTSDPPLPPNASKIDSWAIQNLQQLLRMASPEQARYSGASYQRGTWFGQGLGRAMIGYTESMSAMGEEGRETVAFKLMPLSSRGGVSLFYSDVVGINPSVGKRGRRALALKLASLITSTRVIVESFGPTEEEPYPQYLMPVRQSVFQELESRFPLYAEMYAMVTTSEPSLFRLGPASREWLEATKSEIRDQIFSAPACD